MRLPISLGIKPALITAAVLLVVIGVLGVNLRIARGEAAVAVANQNAAITERDSWKAKTADELAANAAYGVIFDKLQAEADRQQQQADAAAERAAAAVAAARRDEAAAEKTLADFRKRSASKPAPCAAALLAMQSACPTLEHY